MGQLLIIKQKYRGRTIAQAIGEELKVNETIASHFKEWRSASGRSYEAIEAKCGVPTATLITWELGTISPMACMYFEVMVFLGEDFYMKANMLLTELLLGANKLRQNLALAENTIETRRNFKALGAVNRFAA